MLNPFRHYSSQVPTFLSELGDWKMKNNVIYAKSVQTRQVKVLPVSARKWPLVSPCYLFGSFYFVGNLGGMLKIKGNSLSVLPIFLLVYQYMSPISYRIGNEGETKH